MGLLKLMLRWLLRLCYRVRVVGLEHFQEAGSRVLIVANHTSFLDAVLLAAFLPERFTFAINTYIAKAWWIRPILGLVDLFPMDPTNPMSTKSLIRYLEQNRKAVIFPEGRITVTGSLMKVYQGPGLVADKAGAMVLPVRIDGAQFTPFSRLRGRLRLRWFPRITLTLLPPRRLTVSSQVQGRERRKQVAQALADLMTELVFATSHSDRTLLQGVLDARRIHGGGHKAVEDIERRPWSYNTLLTRAAVVGRLIAAETKPGEIVGLMLPNTSGTVAVLLGVQMFGRIPAMLNFTAGFGGLSSACSVARITRVYTARRFIQAARLDEVIKRLGEQVQVHFLEDLRSRVGLPQLLSAAWLVHSPGVQRLAAAYRPQDPAVVLFTSGSEGTPKGVVLSHTNLLSNREQLAARVDFGAQDIVLNALPLFHSFGLTAGTVLPLLSGIKTFLYPSPLHYRIIPEMAYDVNATILFGTNTFLAGYARFAHPYDFYSIRYVFAGAEKLQDEVRRTWAERFGVRIFEGYGATETSPVLAANTPMDYRPGSVGRLLPGIEHRLETVPGIEEGGRLWVKGPNVMLGYLLADRPGELRPPESPFGPGWYDTGDIVHIDPEGFVWIRGRAKRFAKVGGEMISLAAVEALAQQEWPQALHAVVTLPDPQKGEQLVLITDAQTANRAQLLERARREGKSELGVPRRILVVKQVPLLGSGKVDYGAAKKLAEESFPGEDQAE